MSPPVEQIVVLGLGAQAKYVLDIVGLRFPSVTIRLLDIEGRWPHGDELYGVQIERGAPDIESLATPGTRVVVCRSDAAEKRMWSDRVAGSGAEIVSMVHPRASISDLAVVGVGSIVNAGAVVQPGAEVGRGAMLHANSVVEHDCTLGPFVNVAPGARLAGWVTVGAGARVLTGASVIPGVTIGEGAVVGAGAAVIDDVEPYRTVVGVPARPVESRADD